jgi:hypothetical protein
MIKLGNLDQKRNEELPKNSPVAGDGKRLSCERHGPELEIGTVTLTYLG